MAFVYSSISAMTIKMATPFCKPDEARRAIEQSGMRKG